LIPAQPALAVHVSPQTVPLHAKPLHAVNVCEPQVPLAQLAPEPEVHTPSIPGMQPQLGGRHCVVG
jgi:hypothetical protein